MSAVSATSQHTEFSKHGGRLRVAQAQFPHVPKPWIDLSTGINPHPFNAPRATQGERGRLPDSLQLAQLERTAARAFCVDDPSRVVAMPGTELALRLLPFVLQTDTAQIVGPTYSSHLDAWRCAGTTVDEISQAVIAEPVQQGSALVMVNPNNPDGERIDRQRMLAIHDALQAANGWLVVDEAFVDTEPAISVSALAGSARAPKLITLRSFGKFYGLAGVRLGFVIGGQSVTQRLRVLIGDWPVAVDALAAGIAAYENNEWATVTRRQLHSSAQRLDTLLAGAGFAIVGGTSLFRLVRHVRAEERFQLLLERGILVRPFDHDRTLLRFGLPGQPSAWRRLAGALREHP